MFKFCLFVKTFFSQTQTQATRTEEEEGWGWRLRSSDGKKLQSLDWNFFDEIEGMLSLQSDDV